MPEIVKEKRLIENLDENSKKCLKNLCEVLENQQQKVEISQPFDLQNISSKDPGMDFPSLGGKYGSLQPGSNELTSQGIFGGPPMNSAPGGVFAQQTQQNKFQPVYGGASVPFDQAGNNMYQGNMQHKGNDK